MRKPLILITSLGILLLFSYNYFSSQSDSVDNLEPEYNVTMINTHNPSPSVTPVNLMISDAAGKDKPEKSKNTYQFISTSDSLQNEIVKKIAQLEVNATQKINSFHAIISCLKDEVNDLNAIVRVSSHESKNRENSISLQLTESDKKHSQAFLDLKESLREEINKKYTDPPLESKSSVKWISLENYLFGLIIISLLISFYLFNKLSSFWKK